MDNIDKRQARRFRVLKDGKIVMLNNWSVVDCCIRDVSDTGARLSCQDQAAVPNDFRLLFLASNAIRDASVVWRRGDQVGVVFTSPSRQAPPRKW
jgi:hypothetical protein